MYTQQYIVTYLSPEHCGDITMSSCSIAGTSNRTVAATQMNATSSRAHTVVTIMFEQISKNESGQETKKSSIINLVDLAGMCLIPVVPRDAEMFLKEKKFK